MVDAIQIGFYRSFFIVHSHFHLIYLCFDAFQRLSYQNMWKSIYNTNNEQRSICSHSNGTP